MPKYIYQYSTWPEFTWDSERLEARLGRVRNLQGRLYGKMESLGFALRDEAMLQTLTLDALKSSEIEGEVLDAEEVRSSIARRLGMDISGLVPADRRVEGVVEMLLNATQQYAEPLTADRLWGWHAALFPTGRSGMYKITAGGWRTDENGPMQVQSGAMGKERVHFEAPPAGQLEKETVRFLQWFNAQDEHDPVLKAAVSHLWFVTIHPFDDGNGRISRAIADMQLARADGSPQRFYSMSASIRAERKAYYAILEKTQQGTTDITEWMEWFLDCLEGALHGTQTTLENVLAKVSFWERNKDVALNDRQRMMVNKMWDGFEGKLTSSKWALMTKSSPDTALRDILDLVQKNILRKEAAGGRSTNYELVK
jgi:Fic family protein